MPFGPEVLFLSPQHCIISAETTFGGRFSAWATAAVPEPPLNAGSSSSLEVQLLSGAASQDEGQDLAEQLKAESQHE